MKVLAFLLLAVVGVASAKPSENFDTVIRNFASGKGMEYQGLSQIGDNGQFDKNVWTYSFSSPASCVKNCESMSITFEHTKNGNQCVPDAGLFGYLPLNIGGHSALFTSFTLADSTSRSRDVLYADNGRGVCYAVSYGFAGSRFNDSLGLMKKLLGK